MVRCRGCGKQVEDVDEDGYCEDCSDDEDDFEEEWSEDNWTDEQMDDFATCVLNSPFDPR